MYNWKYFDLITKFCRASSLYRTLFISNISKFAFSVIYQCACDKTKYWYKFSTMLMHGLLTLNAILLVWSGITTGFCCEMVSAGHYLYAGEIVGGSIEFWAQTCSIGHGQWERETCMKLLCRKSLRKEHTKVQRRGGRIVVREGTWTNSGRGPQLRSRIWNRAVRREHDNYHGNNNFSF